MKVVADQDLLLNEAALPAEFELVRVPGREISNHQVRHADALLVRSITRVDEALLRDSSIRFVGTATSGLDHIDQAYLSERGIVCADAAGSNADAVADYCMAALAYAQQQLGIRLADAEVALIGLGHVGSRVWGRLQALGIKTRLCDPLLARSNGGERKKWESLEALSACQIVSLHVPLSHSGKYATAGMIAEDFLQALPHKALLINSCRGGVVDEAALLAVLESRPDLHAVIDVWQDEPHINKDLLALARLATPHIAGYSNKAKREAARQIIAQLIAYAQQECLLAEANQQDAPGSSAANGGSSESELKQDLSLPGQHDPWQAAMQVLPLFELSRDFRNLSQDYGAAAFDSMRRQLQSRREFNEYRVSARQCETSSSLAEFKALGFGVSEN